MGTRWSLLPPAAALMMQRHTDSLVKGKRGSTLNAPHLRPLQPQECINQEQAGGGVKGLGELMETQSPAEREL